eukprot:CAMPEP_0116554514 /NCGR_PEP_ID=MMETSP0397-20121206/7635_1 /TAXON_ID=216820 /ORGANISM="Cyclophora tenuis, Strain ECT3854" /LENGTH=188 /DNA_ID=CAMNT_0004079685 /DNA_START=316 /DNA_END=879 /DNA_ORIENTATION=-
MRFTSLIRHLKFHQNNKTHGLPVSDHITVVKMHLTPKFRVHNNKTKQSAIVSLSPTTNPDNLIPVQTNTRQVELYDQATMAKWIVPMPPPTSTFIPPPKDYTVVVGGRTFHHHAALLASAFPTVRKCLTSKLPNRMEFPHRKPEDWTLLLQFVHPSNRDQHHSLNERNVEALLPWFHDMGMTWMMKPC